MQSGKMTSSAIYHIIGHMNMVPTYAGVCTNDEGYDELKDILERPMRFEERVLALQELKHRLDKKNPSEEGQS